GLQVELANNGAEALEWLQRQRFDAVLMDCQMPVMDGYAATREIRAQPQLADLPVIAMTANVLDSDRQLALEAGMNDHVGKPIDLAMLFQILARWISTVPIEPGIAAGSKQGPAPAPRRQSNPADLPVQLAELPGIDSRAGLRVCQGDLSLYNRLLSRFAEQQSQFEEQFVAAQQAGDGVSCRRLAHSLKGSAGNLGARELSQVAAELEQACAEDEDYWIQEPSLPPA
ncbi:MAG: response regulator, partial [Gammaproteobacteria bacterium]|nr:response regulator [Gammaproteobacteria bacterium]